MAQVNLPNQKEAVKKAVIFCRSRDILGEFLKQNSTEVMNMLMTEWNWDDALDVRFEEGREEGREEGTQEERFRTAVNLKKLGVSLEVIAQATGLPLEKIRQL